MKSVIITIDTEGHKGKDSVEKLIFGKTVDGYYGIEKIMSVFGEYDIPAKILFFVDFAEAWDYGEEKIKAVVDQILLNGHDIGVHIHPDHMADSSRKFLYEYSYQEQYEMIEKCTALYRKLVGRKPLSFRAGKYGANYDTLNILCELGYKYDFSEYYHQPWCGIDPPLTINAPCRYKSLVEFPVTMHKSVHIRKILSREDKVDVEGMTPSEFKYALKQIEKQPFTIVTTMFMHSFSLLDWVFCDQPKGDRKKIEKFRSALFFIKHNPNFAIVSEADLKNILPVEGGALYSDILWDSNIRGIYYTYQKAKFIMKRNRKAKLLVYFVRGWAILCGIILLLLLI